MQFLVQTVIFILSSYLAFTNMLAGYITDLLPSSFSQNEVIQTPDVDESDVLTTQPRTIPSTYKNNKVIPDILIKNTEYQQAAVVESIDPALAPATALEALVNIFCTYQTTTYSKTITGTGFLIDTDGVILTNAHVAQFLLLEGLDGEADCEIRTGNPATAMYKAELLYISPIWIGEHAKLINDATPKGTGERDYALLYITSGVDNKPMPSKFAALPFNIKPMTTESVDTEVFATGYPADSIAADGLKSPLLPRQATTTIAELMTFGSNLVDIFTIGGTYIGKHGSSGGPVVDSNGNAIGLISTKGDDANFGEGSLRAISISYIDRTIAEETGAPLIQNLSGNLPYRAQLFKETIVPFLQQILEDEL